MRSLTNLVLSLSLAAGIAGCKRDYSFLGQRDAAGADHQVASDVDGDRKIKYDLGKDVAAIDQRGDATVRDLGRDAPETDGPRADGAVPDTLRSDRYAVDVRGDIRRAYDAATIDAPHADRYSPDAGADRPVLVFPDAEVPDLYADRRADMPPDLGADLPADLGRDLPSDLGADTFNICPGAAPLNTLQAGVCVGSRNSCGATGWQEDYSSIVGYEVNEVSCDGLDNDCDGAADRRFMDSFDRPNQAGLGSNVLGNEWINTGTADVWDIENNDAVASWTGGPATNALASSRIGYRATFDTLLEFELADVNRVGGGGGVRYGVNCSESSLDGFLARIASGSSRSHVIVREGVELATGTFELSPNTRYTLRFAYDGTQIGLKVWAVGSPEPADWLAQAAVPNVAAGRDYIGLSMDLDGGEQNTVRVGYIREECE